MEKTIQETSEGQLRELGQNIGNLVVDYLEKHPKGATVDRAIAYVFKHYPLVQRNLVEVAVGNTFLLLGQHHLLIPVGKKTFRILSQKEMRQANEQARQMQEEALSASEEQADYDAKTKSFNKGE